MAGSRPHRRLGALALAVAVLGAAFAAASCSLVVERDAAQCASSRDCDAKGGAFQGAVCQSGVCRPCSSHRDCAGGALLRACVQPEGRCVEVFSPECQTLTNGTEDVDPKEILKSERVVIVGALFKDDGARDVTEQRLRSVRVALSDIEKAGGIPAGAAPARSLAALVCDAADEPLLRSAKHLAERLKVPAIIGPAGSGRVIKVATEVTVRQGTLLIAPTATSALITSLDDRGLVWRTAPTDLLQAVPLRVQIPALEASLRARFPSIAQVKLAVVAKDDAYGTALAGLLVPSGGQDAPLLNGKPLNPAAPYFRSIVYPAVEGPRDEDRKALSDFAPHIVILLGTTETVKAVVGPLEQAGATASWNPGILPEYVFTDGARGDDLLSAIRTTPSLQKRVRGTVPAYRGSVYDAFVSAYRGAFIDVPTAYGTAGAFDATYLVALSLAAEGPPNPTGELLAKGLGKLVAGERVEARLTELGKGFGALRAGQSINFVGASGELDFDLATGDVVTDIDVWCVSNLAYASSGQVFVGATKTVEGPFACP
ncbi:MAG: hypothetical protein IPG50_14910 [Myxococcales bacterium]|nr:hypothetical protein [Myxococcales bacterium]